MPERVQQADEVVGKNVYRGRASRETGPAMSHHVIGRDQEIPGQSGDVAGVGLQVPTVAVQQYQVPARACLQHASADTGHVKVP